MPVSLEKEPLPREQSHRVEASLETRSNLSAAEELYRAISEGKDLDTEITELLHDASEQGDSEARIVADEVGGISILDAAVERDSVPLALGEQPTDELGAALREIGEGRGDAAVESIIERIENAEQDHALTGDVEIISHNETVERSANYQGNWTEAQRERMKSPDFLQKFDAFTTRGADGLHDIAGARYGVSKDQYLWRMHEYKDRHGRVTSKVEYRPSADEGQAPTKKGVAHYDEERGVVFSDAVHKNGEKLTARQKDITAAHEMYHALVNPRGANSEEVRSGFDFEAVLQHNQKLIDAGRGNERAPQKYISSADELMARMAQVKNYFGMKDDERFTLAHLDYAKKHYVEDTGLDNNMTLFFDMAKDDQFVRLMNTLPV